MAIWPTGTARRVTGAMFLLVIVLLAAAAVRVGFLSDDWSYLRSIRLAESPGETFRFVIEPFGTGTAWRPFVQLWWVVETMVFGSASWAYHLVRIALYVGAAWWLWLLMKRLSDRRTATIAAGVFLTMPFHAESIFWLASLTDLLGVFGAFGAIVYGLAYLDAGRRRDLWLSGTLLLVGLFSKEFAIGSIVIMVVMDSMIHGRWSAGVIRRRWIYVLFAGLSLAYVALRLAALGSFSGDSSLDSTFTLAPYRAMLSRMSILVNPSEFRSLAPETATWWLLWRSKIVVIIFILTALLNVHRFNQRRFWLMLVAAGIIVFALAAPQASILGAVSAATFQHTRFLYAPSVGVAIGLAWVLSWSRESGWRRSGKMALLAIVALAFAGALAVNARPWMAAGSLTNRILNAFSEQPECCQSYPLTAYVNRLPADVNGAYVFHDYRSFDEAMWRRFENPQLTVALVTKRSVPETVCAPFTRSAAYLIWNGERFERRDDIVDQWRSAADGQAYSFSSFDDFLRNGWRIERGELRVVDNAVQIIPEGNRATVGLMLSLPVRPADLQALYIDISGTGKRRWEWIDASGREGALDIPEGDGSLSLCAAPLWFTSEAIREVRLRWDGDQPLVIRSLQVRSRP